MASRKVLALFPGQGSQKVGMGKEFLEASETAKEYFDLADRALGFSLTNICCNGPADQLTRTDIAQPAILTVSTICYELARATLGGKFEVCAAAGHSLGEYSALVAAGVLAFEDAVQLVHKRGRYMQEAVPQGAGKMVAVLGKEQAEIEAAFEDLPGTIQIANVNAPGQIVVAGEAAAVSAFTQKLAGSKVIELQVSAPFHCALMLPAAERLAVDLAAITMQPAQFPVYANFSARPLTDPAEIRPSLKEQVCGRVRWVECLQNAVKNHAPDLAIEFGAGNVLTGLLKRIDSGVPRQNIESIGNLEKLKAAWA